MLQTVEYLEDGSRIIQQYNAQADIVAATTYTADDNVASVTTYEYVYSEDMDYLQIRAYTDSILCMETNYHYDAELGCIGSQEVFYHEDGSQTVNEYDGLLNLVSTTLYAADGSVIGTKTIDQDF